MKPDIPRLIREARLKKGLTQRDLASAAGVAQQTIAKIEQGLSHQSRYLNRVAAALGVDWAEIDPETEVATTRLRAAVGAERLLPQPHIQVFILADDDGVQKIDRREPPLFRDPFPDEKVYGVRIIEAQMSPAYEPGDLVLVSTTTPPLPGSDAFFVEKHEANEPSAAYVRRLVRATPTAWVTRSWAPDEEVEFLRSDWNPPHRVIGVIRRA